MHAGAWLAWAAGAAAAALATTNPLYLALMWSAAWLVHAVHHDPAAPGSRSWRAFALVGALAIASRTALSLIGGPSAAAAAAAALEGFRLAVVLVVFATFNAVADPHGLLRLAPGRLHEAALAASLALSLAPRTVAAAGRVRDAQALRGIDIRGFRSAAALAVPVLADGMEQALALAESMDARGHGHGRRTAYRRTPFGPRAAAIAAAGVVPGLWFAVAGDATAAFLPTDLRWPDVSGPLAAAAGALALPAALGRIR